jgi:hypothetical protein
VYERKRDKQVFYVIPVDSILGKLPVVLIGYTGTIPFAMQKTLSTRRLTLKRDQKTAADGGTSTRGP